jgi:hypothetical protein
MLLLVFYVFRLFSLFLLLLALLDVGGPVLLCLDEVFGRVENEAPS